MLVIDWHTAYSTAIAFNKQPQHCIWAGFAVSKGLKKDQSQLNEHIEGLHQPCWEDKSQFKMMAAIADHGSTVSTAYDDYFAELYLCTTTSEWYMTLSCSIVLCKHL